MIDRLEAENREPVEERVRQIKQWDIYKIVGEIVVWVVRVTEGVVPRPVGFQAGGTGGACRGLRIV
jgi:hypothetical protein